MIKKDLLVFNGGHIDLRGIAGLFTLVGDLLFYTPEWTISFCDDSVVLIVVSAESKG